MSPTTNEDSAGAEAGSEPGAPAPAGKKKPARFQAEPARPRATDSSSAATREVLAYFQGPVYALDRKPHLAQHTSVARADSSPEKVAAAILADVISSLEHQAVRWTGSPMVRQWTKAAWAKFGPQSPAIAHVVMPKNFPQQNACVVWVGDLGLAGRELCIEFALTETDSGVITGFSYRYDLSGTPYIVAVADAPAPSPSPVVAAPAPAPTPVAKTKAARQVAVLPGPVVAVALEKEISVPAPPAETEKERATRVLGFEPVFPVRELADMETQQAMSALSRAPATTGLGAAWESTAPARPMW